jgi:hypothetical protein
VLNEAVVEVRAGRIAGPGQLIGWLNQFSLRFEPEDTLGDAGRGEAQEGFPISRLVDALRQAGPNQREALRRYYLDGEAAEQAQQDSKINPDEFQALRIRMRALVSRKPPGHIQGQQSRTAGAA